MANAQRVDNQIYDDYGERWYSAHDDPIALLRAENALRVPWILDRLREMGAPGHSVLDVGCGGGFLANDLAKRNFIVTGVDLSKESIRVAQTHDVTHSVKYLVADAYAMPFSDESFDVVAAMDFLEHVERPGEVIKECSRLLKKDGLFFFHTFNRTPIANLLAIKFLEKFIKNTPKNMHVIDFFIRPEELKEYCLGAGLKVESMRGTRPVISSIGPKMAFSGVVSEKARFKFTKSLAVSYLGVARKL